ncbi:PRC-barrel domain-containing protein [Pelagicoccus sp. SDUM812005]|nr:PRC-barrel domain-containing protein [Pelagicoccus sp. SDUM812005]
MLYSLRNLIGKRIHALDDDFGACKDFLFDEQSYRIRYIVVRTGSWLPGRKVIISPASVVPLDESDLANGIPVNMDREAIENSPPIEPDEPISRKIESRLHEHYGWIPYWIAEPAGAFNALAGPGMPHIETSAKLRHRNPLTADPLLQSARGIRGYSIRPADKKSTGPLEDLLVDSDSWTLKYAIVDTKAWFVGGLRVIPFASTKYIDHQETEIGVSLTAKGIKDSPPPPSKREPVPRKDADALSQKD